MKIRIISVGKIKEKYLLLGIEEYQKRLQPFSKIDFVEVPDLPIPEHAGEKIEAQIKHKEGQKILEKIKEDDYVIVLDLKGKQWDSVDYAYHLESLMMTHQQWVFVIGGSLGLSDAVRQRADETLCFSRMTFPHPLMKLILMEQIYRCFKIMHHQTYHK